MMRIRHSADRIPSHLKPYIVEQSQEGYTPIDHAAWRYIMRVSRAFFRDHAHAKYLDGLNETGIETERIPLIDEMDLCLSQFGWGAVPVSGFIPPSVFMELMALGILPIAAEMRTLEHLDYTPSPDIVHEAAGHGPILADPLYAAFLHGCGEIAKNCILTKKDMAQYDAIKILSDLKEDPRSTREQIEKAEANLKEVSAKNAVASEATQFARFMWWTAEYGLVGTLENPKIYGAGLLSSVSESFHCLSSKVKKIPLTVACIEQTYDITEPQPQLFVTPSFEHLLAVVGELGKGFAYKTGGFAALNKAVASEYTTTVVLDSGLQISGVLTQWEQHSPNTPGGKATSELASYLKFFGPVQLSFENQELPSQGISLHSSGYSTPLGKVKIKSGKTKPISKAVLLHEQSTNELVALGVEVGEPLELLFVDSGYRLAGTLKALVSLPNDPLTRPLVFKFENCSVWNASNELVYDPQWGEFDLGCGSGEIVSVFGGAADRPKYQINLPPQQKAKALGLFKDAKSKALCELYAKVRRLREERASVDKNLFARELGNIQDELQKNHPQDWLLRLELLELHLANGEEHDECEQLRDELKEISRTKAAVGEMIQRGLSLLESTSFSSNSLNGLMR